MSEAPSTLGPKAVIRLPNVKNGKAFDRIVVRGHRRYKTTIMIREMAGEGNLRGNGSDLNTLACYTHDSILISDERSTLAYQSITDFSFSP